MTTEALPTIEAMDAAFAGQACHLVDPSGRARPMALRRWVGTVDATDRALLLARCRGRTIDLGCGPGRMVEGLAALEVPTMGVDLSPEAIRQARLRGVLALRRDVFGPVPGEGRWDTALLADGNIGIGGDPERLLARVRDIVRPGGRLVVELGPRGTDVDRQVWRLRVGADLTPEFDWAAVGLDAIERLARPVGFVTEELATTADRHAAVLREAS